MRLPIVAAVAAVSVSLLCDVMETTGTCLNCAKCSAANGCTRCADRLFLLLRRDGVTQRGTCLVACPVGYFGLRGRHVNRCTGCRVGNCERCFNRDFCTRCRAGFGLYAGRCVSACPAGSVARHRQCIDQCFLTAPSPWSRWSVCLRDGAPCGFRWGRQSRTRGGPAPDATAAETTGPGRVVCPARDETRECRLRRRRRRCPGDGRRSGGGGRRRQGKPLWMLGGAKALDIF
ncbi:R-spondin-4 isoform X2 [Stigmatopora nigra]